MENLEPYVQMKFIDRKHDCETQIVFKLVGYLQFPWVNFMNTYPQLWQNLSLLSFKVFNRKRFQRCCLAFDKINKSIWHLKQRRSASNFNQHQIRHRNISRYLSDSGQSLMMCNETLLFVRKNKILFCKVESTKAFSIILK